MKNGNEDKLGSGGREFQRAETAQGKPGKEGHLWGIQREWASVASLLFVPQF